MNAEQFTVCPGCGKPVDPNDPTVEYGYKQVRAPTMGKTHLIDGLGAYFHRGHLPRNSPMWRTAEKP